MLLYIGAYQDRVYRYMYMILTYRELRYAVPQFSVGTYMYPLVGADQAPKAADAVVVSKSRLRNGRGVSAEHFVFSSSPCLSL